MYMFSSQPGNPNFNKSIARANCINIDKFYDLSWIVLIIIWVLSAVYVFRFVDRGWIPHDDGILAQMAERVLSGELPHRDFDEIYTGGLSFLYAAAFKILGVKLMSIRIVLFLFFLAFVPALYSISVRLASPVIAGAVTLLGVVWSVPNYFAGLPSWYNLFFAIFGTLALIRHIETQQSKWLFIAGLCGGFSFLVKLGGIYYVAAVFLFLTYREQTLSVDETKHSEPICSSFVVLKGLIFFFFLGLLVLLLRSRLGAMEIFHFLIPSVAICGSLLWLELRKRQGSLPLRVKRLSSLLMPFCLGVTIPIALFLIPYILTNSVSDLYRGVVVLPQKRLQYATMDFPPFLTVVASVPYALLFLFDLSHSRRPILDKIVTTILIVALALALISSNNIYVYKFIWQSATQLAVIAVLTGCFLLVRSSRSDLISPVRRQVLLLLVIMTGLVSLVQFPFAAPIYFCYVAPLVILTLCGVVNLGYDALKPFHVAILAFYFLFALLWTNTGYVWKLGVGYSAFNPTSLLDIDRGGIRVTDSDERLYSALINIARQKSGSRYIYAAPDCPEVYFLSGLKNPTPTIIDFLGDENQKALDIYALLESKGVKIVVINRAPWFSGRLNYTFFAAFQKHFPHSMDLDHFTVRWRE